jgi:DNA (cytosine-5)-methyltransferase 1
MTEWRGVVRTTYYGRLRPDQPAYTIATYYNRPGNGTNITPWEDRTLTSREAARLQSFPDSYVFLGTEGSVRKQIGNAVPPLLAYALGTHLRSQLPDGPCIDLFAGAGGLSLGLEMAGWEIAAAVDNDSKAAQTYTFNRPCEASADDSSGKTLFIEADLSDQATRDAAIQDMHTKLAGRSPALLVGGPPCQGFSHAGWRVEGDRRNDLASIFMLFVEEFSPEAVVLENVEGLLTYGKGQVVADLMTTMHDLGYEISPKPWVLRAECYGVPQMRRRVFLVGTRSRGALPPPSTLMQQCRGRRETDEAIAMFGDLPYPITVAEALADLPSLGPRTHDSMGMRIVRPEYALWCKSQMSTEQLRGAFSTQL